MMMLVQAKDSILQEICSLKRKEDLLISNFMASVLEASCSHIFRKETLNADINNSQIINVTELAMKLE
jgi:hypothetical protein